MQHANTEMRSILLSFQFFFSLSSHKQQYRIYSPLPLMLSCSAFPLPLLRCGHKRLVIPLTDYVPASGDSQNVFVSLTRLPRTFLSHQRDKKENLPAQLRRSAPQPAQLQSSPPQPDQLQRSSPKPGQPNLTQPNMTSLCSPSESNAHQ